MRSREWLEPDGLGGFASGTVSGLRTRRYHALLLAPTTPPTGRYVLVNGFDAWVETARRRYAISSQAYAPDVVDPDGERRITSFEPDPWPRWTFDLGEGRTLEQEIFMRHGSMLTVVSFRLVGEAADEGAILQLRPFFSGRDFHALHHENSAFRFEAKTAPGAWVFRPYDGLPATVLAANARFEPGPMWYLNFAYESERERGLDHLEDLASPGVWNWDLTRGRAVLFLATEASAREAGLLKSESRIAGPEVPIETDGAAWTDLYESFAASERTRRSAFSTRLHRSADAYLVRRGAGRTLIAGYPWFADWGRDTFIALRGLCLATGRLDEAREILLEWSAHVSEGMLPNRFPDQGSSPEYNSVDASLWFVIAVGEFLSSLTADKRRLNLRDAVLLASAVTKILNGYAAGTRYGIRLDTDGLLAAGEPGVQLSWMDAKVDEWVVTPRIGKPVEVQALWLNALRIGCELLTEHLVTPLEHLTARAGTATAAELDRWREWYATGLQSFHRRFWSEDRGHLFDVVDADHVSGRDDATFRPNQILAVGGLPIPILEGDRARRVVEAVEARLWTPLGLRSLAPTEPGYRGIYEGGVLERDSAYHQGTVWPWLLGAFVDAWARVWGDTPEAKREARRRFLDPLHRHLDEAGLGHVSEIADGDAPHTPRGCPFQAWSVGETLWIERRLGGEVESNLAAGSERVGESDASVPPDPVDDVSDS